ncbi:MAG: peptidoglycan editing factor PgeF [Mycobacteriales bacterium]
MSDQPTGPVRRVLTTRRGGRSAAPYDSFNLAAGGGDDPVAVQANQIRLAATVGLGPDRLVWMDQVHGDHVVVVDGPQRRPIAATDALVTAARHLVLVVRVADCVPVLYADQRAGIAAVAHAGRPGARAGIATKVVEEMLRLGSRVEDIDVLLGPAICGACYEVPADMQADLEAHLPGSACTTSAGTAGLDLRAGLTAALRSAGVGVVVADPRCTREDPDLYSYRRDKVTGRFGGLAWIA